MGLGDIVTYKGSQHTVTAIENTGNGKILVVFTSEKGTQIRLKHTDVNTLLDKEAICLNSVSSHQTAPNTASVSTKKRKRSKSKKN